MGNSGCTRKINLFAHNDHLVFVNSMSENFERLCYSFKEQKP